MSYPIKLTPYGFTFGPATVTRVCDSPKFGVIMEVAGKRQQVEIRVTPSGLLKFRKSILKTEANK